ncbi:MAG TPA: 30S ribosomal protein S13 [Candidatus Paceibacterota bacterium]|nr:30S ribosomal protein S13 [Candidatus Paceibacterota bacterium]HMP18755.1 30S ribosomal protein S13 [Candidatus Paceibacterota bacterium]HMP85316.1 30S ribosomal protein S13 [Candidatus Paceibacterota bacterium]
MRILGITLPEDKRIEMALTVIYGIGISTSKKILKNCNIDLGKKTKDITQEEETKIRQEIEKLKLEGDLKRQIANNVKRYKDIQSYKGSRHAKRLPARGQRTKTNSRTVRGNVRKTMGSGRKAVEKK